jgi:hypothetical protein
VADDARQIVVAVVSGEVDRIGQLFARLLFVIAEAFDARVIRVGKDAGPIDLEPDHYGRLTAVDRFIKLLTAGRPVPKAVEWTKEAGTSTLAELEARSGKRGRWRGTSDEGPSPRGRGLTVFINAGRDRRACTEIASKSRSGESEGNVATTFSPFEFPFPPPVGFEFGPIVVIAGGKAGSPVERLPFRPCSRSVRPARIAATTDSPKIFDPLGRVPAGCRPFQ